MLKNRTVEAQTQREMDLNRIQRNNKASFFSRLIESIRFQKANKQYLEHKSIRLYVITKPKRLCAYKLKYQYFLSLCFFCALLTKFATL